MKKILSILILIILAASAGIFYLNKEVLPTKVRGAIVAGLEDATQKKVFLGSVHFNIFKGLVLKDLIIRDELNAIINVKEARCRFFLIPLFNKKIIISRLIFESPDIFIERRADGSINILGLFGKGPAAKSDFTILIQRISIRRATINFHDLTLDPLYSKEIKGLDADISLQLPAKVKYDVKFNIPSDLPIGIDSSGEYSIALKELTGEVRIKDFVPKEFVRYYEKTGISLPAGRLDANVNFKHKENLLSLDTEIGIKDLDFSNDKLSIRISGSERSNLRYDFAVKKFNYTGDLNISAMSIAGIPYIERIDNIKGRLEFSNLGLSSDNMTAAILGLPIEARITMNGFDNPVINVDASSDIILAPFQDMLNKKFSLSVPAEFYGGAKLRLAMKYPLKVPGEFQIKGSLHMLNASVKLNKGKDVLQNVSGLFQIVPNQVSWDDVGFRYHDVHYGSSGALTNFKTPGIQLKLTSKDLSLNTVFALNDKVINFSKFSGKYLDSDISASGTLDSSDPAKLKTDITGVLNMDLGDLKNVLAQFKDKLDRVKPKGIVHAEFSLRGDLKYLKNCAIDANLSSDALSLYGFRLATSTMNYSQKNGSGDILFMRSFLYGGSLGLIGKIDWALKDVPYKLDMNIDGVKIEQFKADTAFKDKDIAGSIKMQAKLKGVFSDIGKLSGEGKIAVTEGRLWQLNLLRGLGVLIFTRDFNNIVFKEGHCDFTIGGKEIITDELTLKSDLVDIYGPLKIGFDKSVNATLKAEFSEDALGGGAKHNLAAAIGNYSLVEVSGTLKDPQYKMKADVESIAESIADNFSGE